MMIIEKISKTNDCECKYYDDFCIVNMTGDTCPQFFDKFRTIRKRGEQYWWLDIRKCKICEQNWLVAQEERTNDIFCLNRLNDKQVNDIIKNNVWPVVFDRYETLLEIAKKNNLCCIFFDPINDSSTRETIEDLALERPYIKISELSKLLNINTETIIYLSNEIIKNNSKIKITFDA